MKKKSISLLFVFALFFFILAGVFGLNTVVKADSVTPLSGASIRLADKSGIRFITKVNDYNPSDDTVKYGILIVPNDMLTGIEENADYISVLETMYPDVNFAYDYVEPYQAGKTLSLLNDEDGYYIVASIVDLQDANYDRDFVSISFKEENSVKTYFKGDTRNIAEIAAKAYADVVEGGVDVDKIDEIIDKSVVAYAGTTEGFELSFESLAISVGIAEEKSITESNGIPVVLSTSSSSVATVANGKVTGVGEGSCTVTASFGKYTKDITVSVIEEKTLSVAKTSVALLTSETVDGTANTANLSETLNVVYTKSSTGTTETTATGLTFETSDDEVVTVDNGVITAVDSGSANITVSGEGYANTLTIPVTVYVPIKTASDMDALSLITYYNDKDTATALMGKKYILCNDIDYSTHVRNFILPIASPAGASTKSNGIDDVYNQGIIDYHSVASIQWFYLMNSQKKNGYGVYAHFSYGWQNILGLTVAGDGTQDAPYYMKKSDESTFNGINPNLVPFTGELNGNGYAIKNAWLMVDNYLAAEANATYVLPAQGQCFIGINKGKVCNLSFDNLMIGNSSTYVKKTATGMTYQETDRLHGGNNTEGSISWRYARSGTYGQLPYVKPATGTGSFRVMETNNNVFNFSNCSAIFLYNDGDIFNLKVNYSSTAYLSTNDGNGQNSNNDRPRALDDGFIVLNTSKAHIGNCIINRTDATGADYASVNQKNGAVYIFAAYNMCSNISDVAISNDTTSTKFNSSFKDGILGATAYQPILNEAKNVKFYDDPANIVESDYVTLTHIINIVED